MNHPGTERIVTERLILRRFIETDADALYANYGSDPEVYRYVDFAPCRTMQGTRGFIEGHIREYGSNPDFYGWAVTLDGEVIGSIALFDMDTDSESCEIGYSIGSGWWGQGYATEAVTAVRDFAFDRIGIHRIQASCHMDNIASYRVLEKIGMRFEGIIRDGHRNPDGSFSDMRLCSVLSTD